MKCAPRAVHRPSMEQVQAWLSAAGRGLVETAIEQPGGEASSAYVWAFKSTSTCIRAQRAPGGLGSTSEESMPLPLRYSSSVEHG